MQDNSGYPVSKQPEFSCNRQNFQKQFAVFMWFLRIQRCNTLMFTRHDVVVPAAPTVKALSRHLSLKAVHIKRPYIYIVLFLLFYYYYY
jgi:hypothetical protein